jgi:hypothetical protein
LHARGGGDVASCLDGSPFGRERRRTPIAGRDRRDGRLLRDPDPAADLSGLRAGPFGRWTDGVTAMRGDCAAFAGHWHAHNHRILTETGPLWVVLGDSTAQGLGAPSPDGGYVGQALAELRLRTGLRWRVLNLSVSGALIRDVLNDSCLGCPRPRALPTW